MTDHQTISETSKDVVREFVEALNEGRLDGLADGFTEHDLSYNGGTSTREEIEAKIEQLSDALSDLTVTIEDMVAEGEMVAVIATASATHAGEFYGAEPTGERIEWAATIFARVEDGEVVEVRVLRDVLGIMTQLGLIPEGET